MGLRITPEAGRARGWAGLAGLLLAFACLCALAGNAGGRPAPAGTRTESCAVRAWTPAGASVRTSPQAQAADDETGRGGQSRSDLSPAAPVGALAAARPEGPGPSRGSDPAFPSGCDWGDSRPRPPPDRAA
jgi:hypothetical protein